MVMYHLICGSRLLVDFTGINTALILFHCNKAMRSVFWASPTCEAGGCCQDIPYAHLPRQIRILPFLVAWSLSSRTGTRAFFEKKSRCLSYLWWYSFSLFIEPSTAARESYISHRTNAAIFSLLLAIVLAKRCKNHGEEQVQDAATVAQVQRSLQCLRWPSPLPVARNKSQNESLWTVMRKSILIIYTVYIYYDINTAGLSSLHFRHWHCSAPSCLTHGVTTQHLDFHLPNVLSVPNKSFSNSKPWNVWRFRFLW